MADIRQQSRIRRKDAQMEYACRVDPTPDMADANFPASARLNGERGRRHPVIIRGYQLSARQQGRAERPTMTVRETMRERMPMLKERSGPLLSVARRVKREFSWGRVWTIVRCKAMAKGISAQEMARARQYGRARWGLGEPNFEHELQRPYGYFPGLTARPVHDPKDFPWIDELEAAFPVIKEEALQARDHARAHQQDLVDSGWDALYFYSAGRKVEDAHRACPETAAVLASIPGVDSAGQAYISVLSPGTHVKPHCGPTNTRLRCHLALEVPDGCRIRTGSEIRQWVEGKALVFDDSFEHEVWHDGDRERIVLLFDLWHPDLSQTEVWAIREMMSRSPRARKYWRQTVERD
jgi:hypothetical protein